jgi:hypothetical protein
MAVMIAPIGTAHAETLFECQADYEQVYCRQAEKRKDRE